MEDTNEIIELNSEEELLDVPQEVIIDKPKKKKKECWLKKLNKKQRIIIVVGGILLVLLIIALVLFLVFKSKKTENTDIILQADNYRYENGTLFFLDSEKKELGSYECENKDEKTCYVAYFEKENDFDIDQIVYEDDTPYLQRSIIFDNNFVFVYDGKIVLYDIKNQEIKSEYESIKKYKDDAVIVSLKESSELKYGVLSFKDGEINTDRKTEYDYIGYYGYDDNLVYKKGKEYNVENKKLSNIDGTIKSYNDKFVVVQLNNGYYLYDNNGKKAKLPEADFITLKEDYIVLIQEKKLFLYDSEYNILNMDGIELSSDTYITIKKVNKSGKVIETIVPFTVTVNADNINVEVDGNNNILNPYESKINNKLSYVTYSDGKIYFYQDEEKTDLIGKYTCKNKNKVSKESEIFENCFIAHESKLLERSASGNVGYIPIYNGRFVFIEDQSNPNVKSIEFYDLKDNKSISTYVEVDAGFYSNDKIVNKANASNVIVIAKKSGNYYVAFKITSSGAETIVKNDKKSTEIKYLKNYLLARYSDGTYHLLNIDGSEITSKISTRNEIVDYYNDYIVVKSDKYQIYNINTGQIISDEFNYISLNSAYYVGIVNNKLNIYNYDSKKKLLCVDIPVVKNDLANSYNVKYASSSSILVTIYGNEDTYYSFNGPSTYSKNSELLSCEG